MEAGPPSLLPETAGAALSEAALSSRGAPWRRAAPTVHTAVFSLRLRDGKAQTLS